MNYKFPREATLLKFVDIDVADRSRQDYGDIEGLAESILKDGLIHPPTVVPNEEGTRPYKLVAGGRRMQALMMLNAEKVPVVTREAMSEGELLDLELSENFNRKQMDWREMVLHVQKAHKAKCKEKHKIGAAWGQRETGQLLGVQKAHVSHCLTVAAKLSEDDSELWNCQGLVAAYKLLLKRAEEEAQRVKAKGMLSSVKALPKNTVNEERDDELLSIFDAPKSPASGFEHGSSMSIANQPSSPASTNVEPAIGNPTSPVVAAARQTFRLSDMFVLGDSVYSVMPSLPDGCVDHVVTDIPYGMDLVNMRHADNIDTVIDTHDVEQNLAMMPIFLRESYRLIKDSGFCVFWYCLDHHEKLIAWAREAGFKPTTWPIVWHKLHGSKNSAAQYNFTKDVEFAMVCRKGEANLNSAQTTTVIAANGNADRKLYSNPFAKPAAVWDFILQAIAYPGQRILDPFAGQMSSCRSVLNNGMIPLAIEIDERHYNAGLNLMTDQLKEMTHNNCEFV